MRRTALIPLLGLLCAFGSCQPKPVQPPKIVEVVVTKIVPVPPELSKDCIEVAKRDNSTGEAVRLANARKAANEECTGRMQKIRGLGK